MHSIGGVFMFENNRDRGQKKWTSIMPTELIIKLREWKQEDNFVKRPELDEFDLQTLQEEVERALLSGLETRITTWSEGILHYHIGTLTSANTTYLQISNIEGKQRISLNDIVAVMLTE